MYQLFTPLSFLCSLRVNGIKSKIDICTTHLCTWDVFLEFSEHLNTNSFFYKKASGSMKPPGPKMPLPQGQVIIPTTFLSFLVFWANYTFCVVVTSFLKTNFIYVLGNYTVPLLSRRDVGFTVSCINVVDSTRKRIICTLKQKLHHFIYFSLKARKYASLERIS